MLTRNVNGIDVVLSDAEEAEIRAEWAYVTASKEAILVPQSVTPYQARRALLDANLLSSVNAAVAAADEATKLAWEFATSVDRNSQFVATLAGCLSLSDQQLDDLFIKAASFL